jgi:hypothetical protein
METSKLYIILLFLLILLKDINSQTFEVTPVYPYCINDTAYISNLEDYTEDHLYFKDDFDDGCNYDYLKEEVGVKYYTFQSDINIINSENLLHYAMIEKSESFDIKIEEIKDLDWKPIESLKTNESSKKSRVLDDFNLYYKIKKEDKKNIVLFRVAKNGNKKGSISMETLENKPNFTDETIEEETDKYERVDSSKYLLKKNNVLLTLFFYLVLN